MLGNNTPYTDYEDIISELDALPYLPDKSRDFIISLVEEPPTRLTPKQVEWIISLKEKYLQ